MLSDLTFEVLAVQIGLNGEDGSARGREGDFQGREERVSVLFRSSETVEEGL